MKIFNEDQILDPQFRAKVLDQIRQDSNQKRKREAKKRHEVYKDDTVKYVLLKLQNEGLSKDTVQLMENRAANVSICRKVIAKLARAYKGGVVRDTGNEVLNEKINYICDLLDFDSKQKKCDRYLHLFKNVISGIVPEPCFDDPGVLKYRLKKKILAPWQYDVLEDHRDPEVPACIILSDYLEKFSVPMSPTTRDAVSINNSSFFEQNNLIGQSPMANSILVGNQTFIWWTNKYHFTTDMKGAVIKELSPEDGQTNPIGINPWVPYSDDQDGTYWCQGGEDLVDGSILVNTLITDMFAIAYMQGWGQIVITGKKVPEKMAVGPHRALVLLYEEGDPEPKVTVVNANPPLDAWMASIEQYVALLLSTNNLSPSSVAVKLEMSNFPSGIAMLVEKSEATGPVEDQQKKFRYGEKREFEIIKQWVSVLNESNSLDVDFSLIGILPDDLKVTTKFNDPKEVTTEKEKLQNLDLRKALGLNTMVELIMMDNPDLSEKDAQAKALKLTAENAAKAAEALKLAQAGLPPVPNDSGQGAGTAGIGGVAGG